MMEISKFCQRRLFAALLATGLAATACVAAGDEAAPAKTAAIASNHPEAHSPLIAHALEEWKGDFDGMVKRGFVPFVPHNDMVQYMLDPDTLDYETILLQDLAWVKKCDALLRLPGESPGADREVQYALSQGLLVTKNIDYLTEANVNGT